MRATEIITESTKTTASKPGNPIAVAHQKHGGSKSGAHKDKTKVIPRNEKHKQKEISEADGNKVQQIEAMISQLEQLAPAVMKLQKNHYEFEAIEDEITSLTEPVSQLSDSSARVDLQDAMETAVESIRNANAAVYEIEKTLKSLVKHANYSLDDARDEAEYESRFGGGPSLEEGSEDIPFAGKRVGQKAGPAGQLKGKDPKGYPKGKLVGGGM
jgi:hypothetical protein